MRFLIDANLPRAVIAVVQSLGHQMEFARDIGWRRRRTNKSPDMHCDIVPRLLLGTWISPIYVDIRLIGTQVLSCCVCRIRLWPKRSRRR